MKISVKVVLLIILVLIIDQWLKFHIKLNYEYGQNTLLLSKEWAQLRFVENEGMAFGYVFEYKYGKLILSLFRIVMVAALFWYIRLLIREKAANGLVLSISLITAGAIGNIIDSAVYGMIFTESPYHGGLAQLVDWGKGYGTFLHGKVVDMFYFPMYTFQLPSWLPVWGGVEFLFFSPIFNVADAAITSGVVLILLFQKSFFALPALAQVANVSVKNTSLENDIKEAADNVAAIDSIFFD